MAEFDDRLRERLLAFQNHHGLPGNGVVDTATWGALVGVDSGAAGSGHQAGTGGQPDAGGPAEAGSGTCDCEVDEAAVTGNAAEQEAQDPPELVGIIEEDPSAEELAEDGTGDEADDGTGAAVGLQARGGRRRPQPHPSVPAQCRANALACFSISQRTAWLLRPGRVLVVAVPALGGRPGHETPVGQFSVNFHDANHYSSKYHAPMPFYVNFAPQVGFHAGSLSVLSHGCVHLSRANAERFFNYLKVGDPVDVVP